MGGRSQQADLPVWAHCLEDSGRRLQRCAERHSADDRRISLDWNAKWAYPFRRSSLCSLGSTERKTLVERHLFAPGWNGWELMDRNINESSTSSERQFDQLFGRGRTNQCQPPGPRWKNLDHALPRS